MAKKDKGINLFRHVPQASTARTRFNMSHEVKFDGDFGLAYPVFCEEVLPGDTWTLQANHFSRLAPMPAPVMHEFDVRFHWFFVPMRLLWDDFEDWMTGGRTGTWREQNPDAFPVQSIFDCLAQSGGTVLTEDAAAQIRGGFWDFMGLNFYTDGQVNPDSPITGGTLRNSQWNIPVMPARGYAMIYNYFFRDQNVEEEFEFTTTSGVQSNWANTLPGSWIYNKGLFKVAWDKDYFTSATLSPQRGPQVYVPIGSSAPLVSKGSTSVAIQSPVEAVVGGNYSAGDTLDIYGNVVLPNPGANPMSLQDDEGNQIFLTARTSPNIITSRFEADLSSSQGAAVNDVREAFALQRFFERMQVVGSRFAEFLRGIWGTNPGDSRLQMPEYLGTWTNPFMINNVSQTSATSAESPQGGYAGNGMSTQANTTIVKNFPEHGYLYCLYVAMPRNGYQQGIAKKLLRTDWLDFANPYFEHIGEQPIMDSELFFNPNMNPNEDAVFGYQSQYASYKFINSHSHGEFKQSLNFWHANRIFGSLPTLSTDFISFNPDESTDRVFQLMDESKFYTQISFNVFAERNLSAFSTPKLM